MAAARHNVYVAKSQKISAINNLKINNNIISMSGSENSASSWRQRNKAAKSGKHQREKKESEGVAWSRQAYQRAGGNRIRSRGDIGEMKAAAKKYKA